MRTYSARPAEVAHDWTVIDAQGVVLGRLAAAVATRLRGKHQPHFTPHIDCGDHVIVINAGKVRLTGRKHTDKTYYRHTGYPGGIRSQRAGQILDGQHPERLVELAVKRMLPRGPLARKQFSKLRVYAGAEHPHTAQSPTAVDVAGMNSKNTRGAKTAVGTADAAKE